MMFRVIARFCFLLVALVSACGDPQPVDVPEKEVSSESVSVVAPGDKLTPEQQKVVVDALMRAKAKEQAEGLGSGTVVVNGAWNYDGYSFLSPDPNAAIEARLVAVDVTISGHTTHFDVDDIEVVDGASFVSYGSDPHAEPLSGAGKLLEVGGVFPVAPEPNRWLLIYAYPKASPALRLYYWGKEISGSEPITIAESGWALPYPPALEEDEATQADSPE